MNGIFLTGIGTDVGKTWAAAGLCFHLGWDYWKPVQAGLEPQTDTERVKGYSPQTQFHPEQFRLKTPASPHFAAQEEDVTIELSDFHWPQSERKVLVEGAGGPLVPLNGEQLIIDLPVKFGLPVLVVIRHYLGSINHSLCAIESIRKRGLHISGLIISGEAVTSSEEALYQHTGLDIIARIGELQESEPYDPSIHFKLIKTLS